MKKLILPIFAFSMLFLASCSSDDDQKPTPIPPKKADLSAITNAFKSIKVIHDNLGSDAKKTPADLVALYNKDIKNHVATAAQTDFANWITHVKDNADKTATKGNAGKLGKRYLDGKGIELGQIVKKGFIGAFQLNGFNAAMMEAVMKAKNKDARKAALDKAVTFLLGDVSYLNKPKVEKENHGVKSMQYPVYDGNEFGKYLNVVSAKGKYKGIADQIYTAFKKAYTQTDKVSEFNASIVEANKLVTTVVAFRGVHYLAEASNLETTLTDGVAHGVSEGLGFAYSLQFAYNHKTHKYFLTAEKGKSFTTVDLWGGETTATKILEDANSIAGMFGFTVEEAGGKPTPTPTPSADLGSITNAFKSIKVIHDNLGSDAKKTPTDLVALYDKDIKKYVATSAQTDFANWITHVKDNADKTATKGNAGKLGKRYLDGKGIELGQIVKKGFIGAFQLNGFNAAMMKGVKATSKDARKAALDEAVTFLLGDVSYLNKPKVEKENHGVKSMQYPVYDGNEFGKYLNAVSAKGKYKGIADKVYEGLKKAYTQTDKASEFNATVLEVNNNVTTAVAFRGVHYLAEASSLETTLTDSVAHGVSEGLGFAYSLQFAYNGKAHKTYFTAEKGKSFTTVDLWGGEATATKILEDANSIAGMFGFTVAEAK